MRVWSGALVLVLLFAVEASAQEASWGIKGGVNFATLTAETDPGPEFGYRIGVLAGGFYTWPITSHLDLQPEGLFSQQGATLDSIGVDKITVKLDSVVVPVLVRYRLRPSGKGLVFFGGPSVGFTVRAHTTVEFGDQSISDDFKDQVESVDYGVVFGAGWEGDRFLLDGRYTWGLSVLSNDPNDADRAKHRVISLLAGVRF